MDSPGFEWRWRRDFSNPSRSVPRTTQLSVEWVPDLIPRGKVAEAWRSQPTPSYRRDRMGRAIPLPPHCTYLACNRTRLTLATSCDKHTFKNFWMVFTPNQFSLLDAIRTYILTYHFSKKEYKALNVIKTSTFRRNLTRTGVMSHTLWLMTD